LDFKRRERLGRVERAAKGEGISLKGKYFANSTWRLRLTEILALACPWKMPVLQAKFNHARLSRVRGLKKDSL